MSAGAVVEPPMRREVIAQPLLEHLVERGHVGLRLGQRLVEVRKLGVDRLGVVAQPVAGLHGVDQRIDGPATGPVCCSAS